jgi:hypothetical protein
MEAAEPNGERHQARCPWAPADLVHDVTSGAGKPADITAGITLDRWLKSAGDDLSPTTLREYRRLLHRRIRPSPGDRQLSRLPQLLAAGVPVRTVSGRLATQTR